MTNAPLSNINGSVVNIDNSNFSGTAFTNRILPQWVNPNVMPEPQSNVQAAMPYIPCKGGNRQKKGKLSKIKKMSRKYKMASKKRRTRTRRKLTMLRRKVKSILKKKKHNKSKSRRTRKRDKKVRFHKGGFWNQYSQNLPYSPTYTTGGELSPNNSALANPVPFSKISNCTNCVDNYNRVTNTGVPTFNLFS